MSKRTLERFFRDAGLYLAWVNTPHRRPWLLISWCGGAISITTWANEEEAHQQMSLLRTCGAFCESLHEVIYADAHNIRRAIRLRPRPSQYYPHIPRHCRK